MYMPGGIADYGVGLRQRGYRHPYAVLFALRLISTIANLKKKPPLTLALVAVMTLLHVRPDLLQDSIRGMSGGSGGEWWVWGLLRAPGDDFLQSVCFHPNTMLAEYER